MMYLRSSGTKDGVLMAAGRIDVNDTHDVPLCKSAGSRRILLGANCVNPHCKCTLLYCYFLLMSKVTTNHEVREQQYVFVLILF